MRDDFASLLALADAKGTAGPGGFELPAWLSDRVWYYVGCAVIFTLAGLITGYFIWRKGSMQTHDAEAEIQRTGEELRRLAEDLRIEESAL
jgi:hypothetical protein